MRVIEFVESSTSTWQCFREDDFVSARELSKEEREDAKCWRKFAEVPVTKVELDDNRSLPNILWTSTPYEDIVVQLRTPEVWSQKALRDAAKVGKNKINILEGRKSSQSD